jgi:hypothetical protein
MRCSRKPKKHRPCHRAKIQVLQTVIGKRDTARKMAVHKREPARCTLRGLHRNKAKRKVAAEHCLKSSWAAYKKRITANETKQKRQLRPRRFGNSR